ncbi:hypothetical protein DL95DRAFT_443066 [Leptodontidium sp. 2 PMI_412]|nr:hypothetical protein DL95DRAFT_443066 [Leptodontidium sp. 2 PMI_412]
MTEDTKPRTFNPLGVPPPPPTYNHVCVTPLIPGSVDLVTLAGLTGFIPSDISSPKTIKEQAPIACDHYIVNETGDPVVDKLDVVERGWGDAWIEFMDREAGGHRPPDTVVGVASLAVEGLLYECEVWAIVRK